MAPGGSSAKGHQLAEELRALQASSFGWAMACCRRDRAEAADVLQGAYAKVLAGDAVFDGRSAMKTWLFGVIRLTALEQRTRGARREAKLAIAAHDPTLAGTPVPAPDDAVGAIERARLLSLALVDLAERQGEVLHLVFYEGLTIEEAAMTMGVTLGTARVHYERGKARLRELLAEKGVVR